MFLKGNKALILIVGLIIGLVIVGGIFIFITRPQTDIKFSSKGQKIIMTHDGGDNIKWKDLRISVTRETPLSFVNPTSSENVSLGPDKQPISTQYTNDEFKWGQGVTIAYDSKNEEQLEIGKYYRVVLKYKSTTDTVITDQNVYVEPE